MVFVDEDGKDVVGAGDASSSGGSIRGAPSQPHMTDARAESTARKARNATYELSSTRIPGSSRNLQFLIGFVPNDGVIDGDVRLVDGGGGDGRRRSRQLAPSTEGDGDREEQWGRVVAIRGPLLSARVEAPPNDSPPQVITVQLAPPSPPSTPPPPTSADTSPDPCGQDCFPASGQVLCAIPSTLSRKKLSVFQELLYANFLFLICWTNRSSLIYIDKFDTFAVKVF